ncbi:MAG: hypothetical protein NTW99_05520, partial [Chloroflexi bacterium]|nr:hypothetical protein [Chloroflexota bacterium]
AFWHFIQVYCFQHKKMNFPVLKGSETTGFGFSYLRPVLEPGLPQYPVIPLPLAYTASCIIT